MLKMVSVTMAKSCVDQKMVMRTQKMVSVNMEQVMRRPKNGHAYTKNGLRLHGTSHA